MAKDDEAESAVLRGVRRAVRSDANAFAYSILITATFGAANLEAGPVSVLRLFAFVFGGTLGFTAWEAVASRGFQIRIREESSDVVLVGTALAPVSVGLGLLAAVGVLAVVDGGWAWFLSPLAATVSYVLFAGLQLVVARRYEQRHPPEEEG